MPLNIAVQMDPIESINIQTDTTYILLKEAQNRNHNIFYYTPNNISYLNGKICANIQKLILNDDLDNFFSLKKSFATDFSDIDIILMRQDPPFDLNYITYTHFLEKLKNTKVINNPVSVRNLPEKIFACNYPEVMPPTLITMDINQITEFYHQHKQIIIKPLYAYGGNDIYKIDKNDNVEERCNQFFTKYNHPAMIQKFLPNIDKGDKRIILINGKAVGAVNRIPEQNKIVSNLVQGGSAHKTVITDKEQKICDLLKDDLINNNIMLAGIDVIDGYLTEINITSPTGIQAINRLNDVKLESIFWDEVEKL